MTIGDHTTLLDVLAISESKDQLALSDDAVKRTTECHTYLHEKIKTSDRPIYGVNTGFGSLCNTRIANEELEQLQVNLLMSHACGTGDPVPKHIVQIMLILKVLSLSKGHSGVQLETVLKLIDLYNDDHIPVVYEQGSLGASGDLAPLAHLALPLIGMGEMWQGSEIVSAKNLSDSKYHLQAKEGLALINGTQFMSAYGVYCVGKGFGLVSLANRLAALSCEAFDARLEPFLPSSHQIRNQPGQQHCASEMYALLSESPLMKREKIHVQDPYSFRCSPQVHGASLDVFKNAETVFNNEINAVTDNPNVFPALDQILSAGNFHGQTLALQLDHVAMALAELASISERRIYKLISGDRGLPDFLIDGAGLNSGFMIPQYTAASIVSQNKQLCTPASVDSIVSSNGQEDHVSMGANSATKCYQVLENTITVLGIEAMVAAQALDFRRPAQSSDGLESLHSFIRKSVPFLEKDEPMYSHMNKAKKLILDLL